MFAPYESVLMTDSALKVFEGCSTCTARASGLLCDLPISALRDFESITETKRYPGGEILFKEGQEPTGVSILCRGRVRLSVGGTNRNNVILSVAEPGAVLGLNSAISGNSHVLTATTLCPSKLKRINRKDFLRFLGEHNEIWMCVARQLSRYCDRLCRVCSVGLLHSADERLAELLLEWSTTKDGSILRQISVAPLFTREDIGRMIGVSRETVSRLFTYLRRRQIAEMKGAVLYVFDPDALRRLARGQHS